MRRADRRYARVMRLAVHADFEYHAADGEIRGENAFALFFVGLAEHVERLTVLGRLDPASDRGRYALGPGIEFVGLPFYESLGHIREVSRATWGSLHRFWRALDDVDAVWLLGPHPLQIAFALIAALRRRRVILGVRQDFPRYVQNRHPGSPLLHLAARALEGAWRAIARFSAAIVVGPDLERRYAKARRLLGISASLIRAADLVEAPRATAGASASNGGERTILTVGRIDEEKNPLLLAEILAGLESARGGWRLVVVGDGPLAGRLAERLNELGVGRAAELRGYVPFGPELLALYRDSDVLLHVSWTEGLPQVLIEAFAAGLPVVATDVGGVREAVGDAAILVPPGDAEAAIAAVLALTGDPARRVELISAGLDYARDHTLDVEARRVAAFVDA